MKRNAPEKTEGQELEGWILIRGARDRRMNQTAEERLRQSNPTNRPPRGIYFSRFGFLVGGMRST